MTIVNPEQQIIEALRSPYAATYVRWMDDALCRGSGHNMVPDIEHATAREELAEQLCNACPVRADCLLYAILNREQGYWGGTDTAQRRKLSAKKDRAKCPVCASPSLVRMEVHEVCLSCGLSWTKATAPRAKLPSTPTDSNGDVIVPERYL